MEHPLGRLYLVTDRHVAERGGRRLEEVIADALGALPWGAALVQLREKDLDDDALAALGRRVLAACRVHGAPLLLNGRVEIARALGADGVHLPEAGGSIAAARAALPAGALIGRSTHGAAAAGDAAADGADIVVVGPVWSTPSKQMLGAPLGEAAVADAARAIAASSARLFAIGGIDDADRAAAARRAGVYGIAVVRAVQAADDPAEATRALGAALSCFR